MNRQFRERVLDRLSKLLELSNSPNSHEAATASRLADALMRKHGLTKEDVRNYTCESRSGVFELPLGAKGFETAWKWALLTATARSCGCEAVALLVAERRKIRLVGEFEPMSSELLACLRASSLCLPTLNKTTRQIFLCQPRGIDSGTPLRPITQTPFDAG